jgi:hypothetical protein
MKKLLILSLAALMVVAFTLPASAFESVFSGYARVRAYSQNQFTGENGNDRDAAGDPIGKGDLNRVDQRFRIGYNAILNDNLKFVSNFEFNASWGESNGTIGSKSSDAFLVRLAHMDFNAGELRFIVGQQNWEFGRGFVMSDSALGATMAFNMGDHLIPIAWFKGNEGNDSDAIATDNNAADEDYVALYPVFNFGDSFSLNPFVVYGYSKNGGDVSLDFGANADPYQGGDVDSDGMGVFWVGANADFTLGPASLWVTAVYQGGTVDRQDADPAVPGANSQDMDVKAYSVGVGGNVPLGPASLHGQFFYMSGDDNEDDNDLEAYFGNAGVSYYWSEIMGKGLFDSQTVSGANTAASNLWAANIGASIKPMEKLSLTGDLWYAGLPEKDVNGEDELGLEIDLKATYMLVEGLNLDIVGAYLLAEDAVSTDGSNDEDPWEVGTRLSLSF